MIPRNIQRIEFGILSPEEIKRYAVIEVIPSSRQVDDDENVGDLFDTRMGVVNKRERCRTCHHMSEKCSGHIGYIDLAYPLIKQEYSRTIKLILDATCIKCSKLIINRDIAKNATSGLHGKSAQDKIKKLLPTTKKAILCPHCATVQPKIKNKGQLAIEYTYSHIKSEILSDSKLPDNLHEKIMEEYVTYPNLDILNRLKILNNETIRCFGLHPKTAHPAWMLWTILPVSPPVVRPNTQSDGQHSYDDFSHLYIHILDSNEQLRKYIDSGKDIDTIVDELNSFVCAISFNNISSKQITHTQTRKPYLSIKSRVDGKEGIFRKNLIAKRVNFNARTVVSAGPHTAINHLGVPKKIAMNLTVPIKATIFNINGLQQSVLNGPDVYPGANYIKSGGNSRNLRIGNRADIMVSLGDEVGVHIRQNDPVLFNRQPTLWDKNILCHATDVVPHNTFRLNLSTTFAYNADFDGDEMNMHLAQSEATLAECKALASVEKHMISYQTSSCLLGIHQDSLVGMGLFTRSGVKFNKLIAAELAIWSNRFDEIDLHSKEEWTSYDIMSLILPPINLNTHSRVLELETFPQQDKELVINDGIHVSGIIDKSTVGSGSHGGIPQIIWRDHGSKIAAETFTRFQEITAHHLLQHGFSISFGDMIVSKESINIGKDIVKAEFKNVLDLLDKIDNGQFVTPIDVTPEEYYETQAFMMLGSPLTARAGAAAYKEINVPDNALASMVNIGSNGSSEHIFEITVCTGQQPIQKKRAPATYGKRTLPFYHRSCTDPISRGYAWHSLLEGYNVIEMFFTAQAGRAGVSSTAISTADVGYLARKMTKMNERLRTEYNYMVTAGTDIVQIIYPFNPTYQEYQKLEHIKINMDIFDKMYKHNDKNIKNSKLAKSEYKAIKRDRKNVQDYFKHARIEDKFIFPFKMRRIILNGINYEKRIDRSKLTYDDIDYIVDNVENLCESLPRNFTNNHVADDQIPDSFIQACRMSCILIRCGLASKRVINEYNFSRAGLKYVMREVTRHFSMAIVPPKLYVGYISAQSISEIGTQMTIDAFHSAGISKTGKKKRAQDFGRFKEIVNVRKEIAEPVTTIPLPGNRRFEKSEAINIKNRIEHIGLREFLKTSQIVYDPDPLNPIEFDKDMVDRYFKYTPGEKNRIPANISPYMIRLTLNRQKVYYKQIDMLVFKFKIEQFAPVCYVIASDINDSHLILRIHIDLDLITDYSTDFEMKHVEKILDFMIHDLYVRGVKGLTNIKVVENTSEVQDESGNIVDEKEYYLEADGNNINGIMSLPNDIIDKTRVETNDITVIYKKYGIEAVRKVIIKELLGILRANKPNMNFAHVRLLADNMTFGGYIMPLNRHGFKRRNPGALARMSFEQNTFHISKAAMHSEVDILKHSPVGSLIFGQSLPCGTGSGVDIRMNESKIGIQENVLDDIF